jgi:hypothetical protein
MLGSESPDLQGQAASLSITPGSKLIPVAGGLLSELLVRGRATTSVLCRGRDMDGHIPVPIYFR